MMNKKYNKKYKVYLILLIVTIIATLTIVATIISLHTKGTNRILVLFGIIICLILSIVVVGSIWIISKKQRIEIKKSFEEYMEELISLVGVGTIMFNTNGVIIWTSKFINDRFNFNLMGKNITEISPEFAIQLESNKEDFIFEIDNIFYETKIVYRSNSIILKDISEKQIILKQYKKERIVIGELDIDNLQEYISILTEEEVFKIQSSITKLLDALVEKYGILYRQYVNGKFIIVMDYETLELLISEKFETLTNIKTGIDVNGVKLTVSAGFSTGSSFTNQLMQLAKEAISQSKARGGNQVTIAYPNAQYKRFGGKTESVVSVSRVLIAKTSKLFFNKLNSKSIKNVLIYGHTMADLDALGSTYAVWEQAKAAGKNAFIVGSMFDNSTKKAINKIIENSKDVFIKPSMVNKFPKESSMVVLCDVAYPNRTENINAFKDINPKNIFIFDHHRVSEIPKGVIKEHTYIDSGVSSASEIVSELIMFSEEHLKPSQKAAQLMLAGIYLDTKTFQKQVSSRTFAAASWLETFGAKAAIASNLLKITEEQTMLISKILSNLEEVKPGYYIVAYNGEVESDVVAVAADEILRTQGRKAAFVIAKIPGKQKFKLSARSIGVNIQLIAESVGGGGHFSASAAVSNESLEVFKDNVIQAIVSGNKYESNNN